MTESFFYLQQLRAHYPELLIDSVVLNDDGQYNDVVIVNDTLVFRFAKVPDAINTLHLEITILNAIRLHLPVAVPEPIYTNIESGVLGEAFMGYRLIPGRPLWRETFDQIAETSTLERIASQLAQFLHALHHLPTDGLVPIDLPLDDTVEQWTAMYRQFREKLFPYMSSDACDEVTRSFDAFIKDPALHFFEPCLRHGDFGGGNILFDPERKMISGILDFACTCLGDPAVDFAALLGSFGREFYERCYPVNPAMEQALPRVEFAISTFALQEALFGIENDDRNAFESGIADYR